MLLQCALSSIDLTAFLASWCAVVESMLDEVNINLGGPHCELGFLCDNENLSSEIHTWREMCFCITKNRLETDLYSPSIKLQAIFTDHSCRATESNFGEIHTALHL